MNIIEIFKNSMIQYGAGWVLWLLIGLSVIVVVTALERWLYYRRCSGNTQKLATILEARLQGKKDITPEWPAKGQALAIRVAEAGLAVTEGGQAAAEQAMQSRVALEREFLESRLTLLGTIGNNAPFIGLLGTVIGVVHAFEELSRAATAGQQQSSAVMAGIAEALVATAVGLIVAIPAVAIYNYFHRRMAGILASSEVLSRLVLAHIAMRPVQPSSPFNEQLLSKNGMRDYHETLPSTEVV